MNYTYKLHGNMDCFVITVIGHVIIYARFDFFTTHC